LLLLGMCRTRNAKHQNHGQRRQRIASHSTPRLPISATGMAGKPDASKAACGQSAGHRIRCRHAQKWWSVDFSPAFCYWPARLEGLGIQPFSAPEHQSLPFCRPGRCGGIVKKDHPCRFLSVTTMSIRP
jgi:hypothetical protein